MILSILAASGNGKIICLLSGLSTGERRLSRAFSMIARTFCVSRLHLISEIGLSPTAIRIHFVIVGESLPRESAECIPDRRVFVRSYLSDALVDMYPT